MRDIVFPFDLNFFFLNAMKAPYYNDQSPTFYFRFKEYEFY